MIMSVSETKKKGLRRFLYKEVETDRDTYSAVIKEFEEKQRNTMPPPPKLIVRSNIMPTKCERCKSVYQAGWEHTRSKTRAGVDPWKPENLDFVTECPCCGWYNIVEFEEGERE